MVTPGNGSGSTQSQSDERGQADGPEKRAHRGPDSRDVLAFGPPSRPDLRSAVADLSWLLSRGYAVVSALKLAGDRWRLTERQRQAVRRAACSDQARERRRASQVAATELSGRRLLIDGFNVLTTIEAALGGAVVLVCRDQACRDIAGVHGSYRRVAETQPALAKLAAVLVELGVRQTGWLFDRPVSNSGRIRSLVLQTAAAQSQDWSVQLADNPDPILEQSREIVATSDSVILDRCAHWFNLARYVIETRCTGSCATASTLRIEARSTVKMTAVVPDQRAQGVAHEVRRRQLGEGRRNGLTSGLAAVRNVNRNDREHLVLGLRKLARLLLDLGVMAAPGGFPRFLGPRPLRND